MRAFVHTVGESPFNEECASAWKGFERLGVEVVPFSNNEQLESACRDDVVVGGMLVCEHVLSRFGAETFAMDYPESLKEYFGRRIWSIAVGAIKAENLPLFVKPVNEKDLPGRVVPTLEELEPYLAKGRSYPVYASDPVDLASEWRCFVRHRRLIGAACYNGDATVEPDWLAVAKMVDRHYYFFPDCDDVRRMDFTPAGYAMDVGVTRNGKTILVEVNDGYALGSYGLNDVAYALLLAARWSQLMGRVDPLREVRAPDVEGPLGNAMREQRWTDFCYGKPGAKIPQKEAGLPRMMWGIAANVREYPRNMTDAQAEKRRRGTKHFAAGTLVWVLEESWDPWYRRTAVVGKKKGTHRYIRKVMSLDELENFRAKRTFSPTVISWMCGAREWIPNYGSGDCRHSVGHFTNYVNHWGREGAESLAELWNEEEGADGQ